MRYHIPSVWPLAMCCRARCRRCIQSEFADPKYRCQQAVLAGRQQLSHRFSEPSAPLIAKHGKVTRGARSKGTSCGPRCEAWSKTMITKAGLVTCGLEVKCVRFQGPLDGNDGPGFPCTRHGHGTLPKLGSCPYPEVPTCRD